MEENRKQNEKRSSKKLVTLITGAALVLSLGTMTAFAAAHAEKNLVKNEGGVISYSNDDGATWNTGAPEGFTQIVNEDGSSHSYVGNPPDENADSFAIRLENGVEQYSTDGGATWNTSAPQGVTKNADGSIEFRRVN